MKTNNLRVLLIAASFLAAAVASAKLNVVATLPDFAAIAREIGGDEVKVTALAKGSEDAHFVDARPNLIRVLNQADVLIEGGADLEIGWLPPLVQGARNRKILAGQPGYVDASRGIDLLEVPTGSVDRSQGDVHARGNPHYWLDPANGKIIAAQLAEVFARLDPAQAALFQSNLKRFNERLGIKLAEWTGKMAPCRGLKVVTYHKTFEYFTRRFGLEVVGQLEAKPGIEPSPTHIANLIPKAKADGVKVVMIEPFRPRRTPAYVAEAIGARLVLLPDKVDSDPKAKDYFSLFDQAVALFTAAIQDRK